jgi:hypothetical protein
MVPALFQSSAAAGLTATACYIAASLVHKHIQETGRDFTELKELV